MKCLECLAAGDARERTEGSWGTALPRVTGEGLTEDREEEREPAMWIAVKWLFSRGLACWGTRERPVWLERGGGGEKGGKGGREGGRERRVAIGAGPCVSPGEDLGFYSKGGRNPRRA